MRHLRSAYAFTYLPLYQKVKPDDGGEILARVYFYDCISSYNSNKGRTL